MSITTRYERITLDNGAIIEIPEQTGLPEVPATTESEAESIGALEGIKISVDEFPILAEGTTLQLNGSGTWGVVGLPVAGAPL